MHMEVPGHSERVIGLTFHNPRATFRSRHHLDRVKIYGAHCNTDKISKRGLTWLLKVVGVSVSGVAGIVQNKTAGKVV